MEDLLKQILDKLNKLDMDIQELRTEMDAELNEIKEDIKTIHTNSTKVNTSLLDGTQTTHILLEHQRNKLAKIEEDIHLIKVKQ